MRLRPCFALPFLLLPALASAGQVSAVLRVSLRVVASCAIETPPLLTLPDYAPRSGQSSTATGAVSVRCTKDQPAAVYLDGPGALTDAAGDRVAFTVSQAGHPWNSTTPARLVGLGHPPVSLPYVLHVPGGQRVPPGTYAGQMLLRVEY